MKHRDTGSKSDGLLHRPGFWRKVSVVLAASLLIAVGAGAASVIGGSQPNAYALGEGATGIGDKKIITVSGNGELMAEPDVAYLEVAVETRAATAKEAQANNATKFASLGQVLSVKYGVAAKEVKTVSFNVQPEYKYEDNKAPVITGYTANHTIRITYRKLESIGTLLDALSAAGANRINNVQFDIENKQEYELQALKKAMANADAKAAVLATASKRQLKGVISVNENNASAQPIYRNYDDMAKSSASDSAASTSIQSGEITIQTDISVVYEME